MTNCRMVYEPKMRGNKQNEVEKKMLSFDDENDKNAN